VSRWTTRVAVLVRSGKSSVMRSLTIAAGARSALVLELKLPRTKTLPRTAIVELIAGGVCAKRTAQLKLQAGTAERNAQTT
jgi:hypothetical protein